MKIKIEPLKYMGKMTFASLACAGGVAIYELRCKNEELLLKITGLVSIGWGIYELGKNTVLSIASNFKKNLESKIE